MNESAVGQERLVSEVLEQGICVRCGACVGLCPYFEFVDGAVTVMDKCRVGETWRCVMFCPRLSYEPLAKEEKGPLGSFKRIVAGRANVPEIREKAQYGGVVTASILFALENGLAKTAVLTSSGKKKAPQGVIAGQRDAVISCAGSRYTGSGTLSALNQAIKQGYRGIAVVGLPCQMAALARIERHLASQNQEPRGIISLKIGLFCTWALDYRKLTAFLESQGITSADSFDIPPPPSEVFVVKVGAGSFQFPLSDIRKFIQPGCFLCKDMTAETTDISVGTLEGRDGWNTVLIRTQKGEELIDKMASQGILQVEEYPGEVLAHLIDAASNKRKKAQERLENREELHS